LGERSGRDHVPKQVQEPVGDSGPTDTCDLSRIDAEQTIEPIDDAGPTNAGHLRTADTDQAVKPIDDSRPANAGDLRLLNTEQVVKLIDDAGPADTSGLHSLILIDACHRKVGQGKEQEGAKEKHTCHQCEVHIYLYRIALNSHLFPLS